MGGLTFRCGFKNMPWSQNLPQVPQGVLGGEKMGGTDVENHEDPNIRPESPKTAEKWRAIFVLHVVEGPGEARNG